jgi:hypothetical protein
MNRSLVFDLATGTFIARHGRFAPTKVYSSRVADFVMSWNNSTSKKETGFNHRLMSAGILRQQIASRTISSARSRTRPRPPMKSFRNLFAILQTAGGGV